ncbi:MAG: dihydrofolate reductase family protein [Actinomycetota bacterium]
MAELVYTAITSLDGYVADASDNFDWAAPDEEVHAFVNDLSRPIGTFLLGRRMYEVLVVWEDPMMLEDESSAIRDFAQIWRSADKIVFSTTLGDVSSARTRIERTFEPDAVRELKASADRDISVAGPHLAAEAIRAGLVDEISLFLNPIVVGSGNASLPDDFRAELELQDEHRFSNGVVYVRYLVVSAN